jgi:pimeloyl-ACP methyl ester carboxylesterase
VGNPEVGDLGMDLLRRFDSLSQLPSITSPTLVCVGELDPITPLAASQEIVDGLTQGVGRFEVIEGAGHFPWLDAPDRYWPTIRSFLAAATPPETPPLAHAM